MSTPVRYTPPIAHTSSVTRTLHFCCTYPVLSIDWAFATYVANTVHKRVATSGILPSTLLLQGLNRYDKLRQVGGRRLEMPLYFVGSV